MRTRRHRLICLLVCCSALIATPSFAYTHIKTIPRVVIGIYDSTIEHTPKDTLLHQWLAMPLNHLGLHFEYHDLQQPLPDLSLRPNVRAIITAFPAKSTPSHARSLLTWLTHNMDQGRKVVIMENPIFQHITDTTARARFLRRLGLKQTGPDIHITHAPIFSYQNTAMTSFERPYHGPPPPFPALVPTRLSTTSHLTMTVDTHPYALITTSKEGGYVAQGYGFYHQRSAHTEHRYWYINPFMFLEQALATQHMPKPDVTTLAGRPLFFAQIDGDGWNAPSNIEQYARNHTPASAVVLTDIVAPSSLPFTIGMIAADLDPAWAGKNQSRQIAQQYMALPHVEIANHTYSHPLDWQFFAHNKAEAERPYLPYYPDNVWNKHPIIHRLTSWKYNPKESAYPHTTYHLPRSYAAQPFQAEKEIQGASDLITSLLPRHKKISLMTWSGNHTPFPAIFDMLERTGLPNINGSHLPPQTNQAIPSVAWVPPIGIPVRKHRQLYAGNKHEQPVLRPPHSDNSYRLVPQHIYLQMYAGKELPYYTRAKEALTSASTQPITPIFTSEYAKMAQGFYRTHIAALGPQRWQIKHRHHLQTIRFDHRADHGVDFHDSTGVIGYRHHNNSLYVYLDKDEPRPIIALAPTHSAPIPYLIDSRWQVFRLRHDALNTSFMTAGFGKATMRWHVPNNALYRITTKTHSQTVEAKDNLLTFTLEAESPTHVTLSLLSSHETTNQ